MRSFEILTRIAIFAVRYAIWYHLYYLKNMKNTHGGVLHLVKLQVEACNFTKSNTSPWVFFTLYAPTPQNGQTYLNNSSSTADALLECI